MRREKGENSLYSEIRKGKKYWRAVVTIGYDEEGKQIRKTVSGYDKSKVIEKMKDLEKKVKELSLNLDFKGTVESLFRLWSFKVKKPQIQPRSFEKYDTTHRLRLKNTELGNTDIQEVTSLKVQSYFNELQQKASEETSKQTLVHLKAFFEYLVYEDVIYKNPCKNIKIKTEIKISESYQCYTAEDQVKIIEALDLSDEVEMMIYLGFATGLRLGELIALTWDDYKDEHIIVNKQFNRSVIIDYKKPTKRNSEIKNLKTASSYGEVPLSKNAVKKLNKYKLEQLEKRLMNFPGYEKNNLMFPNEKGKHQNLNRPARRVKSICKRIGVEYISFHAIRHSYITRLFEQDVNIKKVQKLARHSSPETTLKVYTHTNKDMLKEVVENINNVL